MEMIAAAANLSVMTLYRHFRSKESLFAAAIADACGISDDAEQTKLATILKNPLADVLLTYGLSIQRKLTDPETVALIRVVVAETTRFPSLADLAYRGLIGNMENLVQEILAMKEESRRVSITGMKKLSGVFIDRLCGVDLLRLLLGFEGISQAERQRRAEGARDELLAAIALVVH